MYYSKIAFIIILACVIIYSAWGIPQGMMTAVKARELENKLVKQKMALMLSQIQPHFIYNVLNSIYHLCEIDSSLAQKTITDFSDYLRINFSFKDVPDLIAFEKELKHILWLVFLKESIQMLN
jgi:LytS/YehU family sensor histidine kinase